MNQPSTPPATAEPESLTLAERLVALASAAVYPHDVGAAHFSVLPPGYSHKDITDAVEKAGPQPSRKRGSVQLGTVESLLKYCADQKAQDAGLIYADVDSREIVAVFNENRGNGAGWRDHRASFRAEHTPEFKTWMAHNKKQFDQGAFAEFIEDNFADLRGDDAPTLLAVATTIQAKSGINFSSAKRLDNGQAQLTYTEQIDTRAGADGSLSVPQTFSLGLRIFTGDDTGYILKARLKYRLAAGAVKFFYELDRPERSVEDAFNGYVKQLEDKSGYIVLAGKA